jgi:hypothetical protein
MSGKTFKLDDTILSGHDLIATTDERQALVACDAIELDEGLLEALARDHV